MPQWRYETTPNGAYDYSSPEAVACWTSAMAMHAVVPLVRARLTTDAGDSNVCTYRIEAADGRVWLQTLTFAGPADMNPTMTFQVNDAWKLSEFALQRPIRDALVTMRSRGQIEVDLRRVP